MNFAGVISLGGCWIAEHCELSLTANSYLFSAHRVRLGLGLLTTSTSLLSLLWFVLPPTRLRLEISFFPPPFVRLALQLSGSLRHWHTCLLAPSRAVHHQLLSANRTIPCDLTVSSMLRMWVLILGCLLPTPCQPPMFPSSLCLHSKKCYPCVMVHFMVSGRGLPQLARWPWAAGQLADPQLLILTHRHCTSDRSPKVSMMFSDLLMTVILAL